MTTTSTSPSHFYVTLFSDVSRDIFDENTYAHFTVKLAQPVNLISNSNQEVGLRQILCSWPHIEETTGLIYFDPIST